MIWNLCSFVNNSWQKNIRTQRDDTFPISQLFMDDFLNDWQRKIKFHSQIAKFMPSVILNQPFNAHNVVFWTRERDGVGKKREKKWTRKRWINGHELERERERKEREREREKREGEREKREREKRGGERKEREREKRRREREKREGEREKRERERKERERERKESEKREGEREREKREGERERVKGIA